MFALRRVEHRRFVQIHVLLGERDVIHQQFQVGKLMLDVGLAQAHADRPFGHEALGFIEIKLVIVALAFALQDDQFIMRARNRALQLGARVA